MATEVLILFVHMFSVRPEWNRSLRKIIIFSILFSSNSPQSSISILSSYSKKKRNKKRKQGEACYSDKTQDKKNKTKTKMAKQQEKREQYKASSYNIFKTII